MAYSSTPEGSTHQTKRIPIIGGETIGSNVLWGTTELSDTAKGARFINCYPKRLELVNTDDKWVLTKCPSIVSETLTFTGSGTDPIRCVSSDGRYIWKGRRLYLRDLTVTLQYTDVNDLNVKSMFEAVNPSGTDKLYAGIAKNMGTGQMFSYQYNATTNTFTLSAAISFLETSDSNPFQSVFFNGRLFCVGNNGRLYNTPPGNYTTWNSTNFTVPEFRGDALTAITLYKNYLVAFSTASIEFYIDGAVELGSPLVRQDAYIQLYNVRYPRNICQLGDNIFFLSYEDQFGYGVYTIDNFNVKRVSNFYVDTLLNNEGVTGISPLSTTLQLADFYGDPIVMFNGAFAGNLYVAEGYYDPVTTPTYVSAANPLQGYPYICLSGKHRQWFDFYFSNDAGYNWSLFPTSNFFQLAPNSVGDLWRTHFVTTYGAAGSVTWQYFSKDYSGANPTTAEVYFDINDFGSNLWKHVKYVDAVGDFGNNTVSLSWTPNRDYTSWVPYVPRVQSTLGYKNAIRWHNLGRHRGSAYKMKFVGTTNIMLEGLEVNYNLGTN